MRILAGVPRGRGVKRRWGCRRRQFSSDVPPRGTAANIRTNLILLETTLSRLHFRRCIYLHSQGHPRKVMILVPIESAYATSY